MLCARDCARVCVCAGAQLHPITHVGDGMQLRPRARTLSRGGRGRHVGDGVQLRPRARTRARAGERHTHAGVGSVGGPLHTHAWARARSIAQGMYATPAALLLAALLAGTWLRRARAAAAHAVMHSPIAAAAPSGAAAAWDALAVAMRRAELEGYTDAGVERVHAAAAGAGAACCGRRAPPPWLRRAGVYAGWQFVRTSWRFSRLRRAAAAGLIAAVLWALCMPLIIGRLAEDGWGVVAAWGAAVAGSPVGPCPEVHTLLMLLFWGWLLPLAHALALPADSVAAEAGGGGDRDMHISMSGGGGGGGGVWEPAPCAPRAMTARPSFAPYALLLAAVPLAFAVVTGVCYGTGALFLSPVALPGALATWAALGAAVRNDVRAVRGRGSGVPAAAGPVFAGADVAADKGVRAV